MFYTAVDRSFAVVGEEESLRSLQGELCMIYQIQPELQLGTQLGAILMFRLGAECHLSAQSLLKKRGFTFAVELFD